MIRSATAARTAAALVVLALLARSAAARDPARSARVDAAVGALVKADGPGCAVIVIENGKVVHDRGYGLADIARRVPITTTGTAFDLASCSKQFTGMACLILADRGRLSLADDVRKHLPELPSYGPRPIRVEDLLHQTSGLRDYLDLAARKDVARMRNMDVLALVAREKTLDFATGTKFEYSNTNYCLVALIVERVSKKTLGEFLKAEVFEPLGMAGTQVFERPGQVVAARTQGYGREGGRWTPRRDDGLVTGDGNVFSSAADLALWDGALRDGDKLVKPASLALAFTPGKLDSGEATDYGFGWCVGSLEDGRRFVNHAGGWTGASTYIMRVVEGGLTVIVLSNDEGFDGAALGEQIEAIYLGE